MKASVIGKTLAVKQKGDSLVPKMKEELTDLCNGVQNLQIKNVAAKRQKIRSNNWVIFDVPVQFGLGKLG